MVRIGLGEHLGVEVRGVRVNGVERVATSRLGSRAKPASIFETVFRNRPIMSVYKACEKHGGKLYPTEGTCPLCDKENEPQPEDDNDDKPKAA